MCGTFSLFQLLNFLFTPVSASQLSLISPNLAGPMKSLFHTLIKLVAFYLLLLLLPAPVMAGIFPAEEWVDRLSRGESTDHSPVRELELVFSKMDSTEVEKALTQIEKEGRSEGPIFQLRLLHARIWFLQDRNQPYGMEKLVPLLESMMGKATATNDEELIAYASWVYGSMMYSYNELEPAVTYSLKALEIGRAHV